ncbi:MAG: guanylyltransferase [Muribaculaceae bacterium]|nr:guanylyltransferase [Muribaculaceae bacterium]
MQFDDLDKVMRVFESSNDRFVLPEVYVVARIDGRSFTKLTKQTCKFEAPFDEHFRDMMVGTVRHLMQCGFNVLYGYTQSDEISLLLDKNDATFHRKARKLVSVLAGEASAAFSVQLGKIGAFDCRLCELPTEKLVVDYFRWRQADAHRNTLNAHCYWKLRQEGLNKSEATRLVSGKSIAEKNEMLFQRGINFDKLPSWQKRGIGFYHAEVERKGYNPITKQPVITTRKTIVTDMELPFGEEYGIYINNLLQ